jgi:hypothetical protein
MRRDGGSLRGNPGVGPLPLGAARNASDFTTVNHETRPQEVVHYGVFARTRKGTRR